MNVIITNNFLLSSDKNERDIGYEDSPERKLITCISQRKATKGCERRTRAFSPEMTVEVSSQKTFIRAHIIRKQKCF